MNARRRSLIVLGVVSMGVIAAPLLLVDWPLSLGMLIAGLQLLVLFVVLRVWISLERSTRKETREMVARLAGAIEQRQEVVAAALSRETSGIKTLVQDVMGSEATAWRARASRTDDRIAEMTTAANAILLRVEDLHTRVADTAAARAQEQTRGHEELMKGLTAVRREHKEHAKVLQRQSEKTSRSFDQTRRAVIRAGQTDYKQLESLAGLYWDLSPDRALPGTRGWSAAPDLLHYLTRLVAQRCPTLVLECGSGTSTVIMALAMRRHNPAGRVIALEHLPEVADETLRSLHEHACAEFAEVRIAPLAPVEVGDEAFSWYSLDAVPEGEIDLLFVDGPPGKTGPQARYPALPLLSDRLSPDAVVVLDDYERDDESEVVERWLHDFPHFEFKTLRHEKGTAALRRLAHEHPSPRSTLA